MKMVYVVERFEEERMENNICRSMCAFSSREEAVKHMAKMVDEFRKSGDYDPEHITTISEYEGYVEVQDDNSWYCYWQINELPVYDWSNEVPSTNGQEV